MRLKILRFLALALVCSGGHVQVSLAETGSVRFGTYLRDAGGQPLQKQSDVSDVLERLSSDIQLFVAGIHGCTDLVATPLGSVMPRDNLRDTWTVIQTIRAQCWALAQLDEKALVSGLQTSDRITPAMVHGIIAHAKRLSDKDAEWAKVLMTFAGGEIACREDEWCRLSRLDGRNPPEQSLDFQLIIATQDIRFIIVTQMVYGKSGFVYGVMWRESGTTAEVVSIFPNAP
jgi:hypothetical protein